ncbi:serine protease [Cryobacterium sp. TMT2-18-3]|uniref:trypsin-like serine peptidase n=1 Tax=Cryobacterium sp. TMT2-18-3 TaxID=1259250 RepID=UPI00351A20E3
MSALFVTGGLVASGSAGASAATQSTDVDRWVVPETQQGGEYWTAERMRTATPGDVLVVDNVASAGRSDVEVGQEKKVTKQSRNPKVTPTATQQTPVDHIGKVFFTLGGSDYVCSGNAISAANESTVATAGHCVNEGPGAFASRLVFVPAYENGAAPFGQWNATELYAPTQWTSGGDITYDTGFAIVSSPTGVTLSDTVGASGVAFNDGRGLTYSAFGYPAAAPFTGNTLQSCSGTATDDPYAQSESQGIPCDMTGGSSGGPWFIGSGSAGYQNSVNSFGYNNVANTMFGPYWGSVIESAYAAAAA